MLKVIPVPTLKDNYTWLIQQGSDAAIVDAGEAEPILDYLAKNSLNLTACLITHNHWDHTDGLNEILAQHPNIKIYGASNVSQWANVIVKDHSQFELFGKSVEVLESAGHIEQHLSFLVDNAFLFCGDELFSAGCGRTFTGNYAAHFEILQRFKQLANSVKVCAGHEYTKSNLKFALSLTPLSCTLSEYDERADILLARKSPTLPTTIGEEKQINPFLQAENVEEFTRLRKLKDQF